ncbi:NACHT domain-containing protein [Empedobacter brevis]
MNDDWQLLVQKIGVESSRIKFEEICEIIFKKLYPNENPRTIKVSKGDGGIDIFIGEIGIEPIEVIQCKFFNLGVGDSQKQQIKKSFRTAIESDEFEVKKWTLCLINILDLKQSKWWSEWKDQMTIEYNLSKNFINLKDGNDLVLHAKEQEVYNICFDRADSIKIDEIHKVLTQPKFFPDINLKDVLKKSSIALGIVKNYINNNLDSHLVRDEVTTISEWINNDLIDNKKNILVVSGDKGIGKSAILRDVYDNLDKDHFYVLGIKADKYYSISLSDLEKKIFDNQLTFENIFGLINNEKNKKFIVFIDQIDALSLTLSSNREYLETYNKLISILENKNNIRIIISSRAYDLKYDADLSVYDSNVYTKIEVNALSIEKVNKALALFNIKITNPKLIELLRVPNHLDIFCKIYNDGESLNGVDSITSLKDLYDQLWKKYISPKKLRLKKLLFKISKKMYFEQRISIGNIYDDDFFEEINYLNSNSLLIHNDNELQFFHQSFYEYCFAKYFVESKEDLGEYIIENEQSLYVRSVVKMVIEYLRDYDINKYILTIKNILSSEKYRFHIKTLIINTIGFVQYPTENEKKLVLEIIFTNKDFEEVFISSVFSSNWIQFIIAIDLPYKYLSIEKEENETIDDFSERRDKNSNLVWILFRNNMNRCPLLILDYLKSIEFNNQSNFLTNLIIQIDNWEDKNLIKYFEEYIIYSEDYKNQSDNFWYYRILEKIFLYDKEYVFKIIKDKIKLEYKTYKLSYDFDYSLDKIIEYCYSNLPLDTFNFLLNTYEEISENTKSDYLEKDKVNSPLYYSFFLKESQGRRENDLQSYLLKFLKDRRDEFISELFTKYKFSNNIAIQHILVKGLSIKPILFKNNIIELIEILNHKKVLCGRDDEFQLLLRQIVANVYQYLDKEQLIIVNNIILSIRTEYDYWIGLVDGIRKVDLSGFGKKKYLFLKSLPLEILKKDLIVYKCYQELSRKFGDLDHNKALHSSSFSITGVGAPLSVKAYNNMNFKNWKKSMLIFNEGYKITRWSKGGIDQHSSEFRNCVKDNPIKFYSLVKEIILERKVSIQYIIRGIQGLVDGDFEPQKVKELYKKCLSLNIVDNHNLISFNFIVNYFIKHKIMDLDIVNYLHEVAINFPFKEKELNPHNLIHDGINSVRGSAIYKLIHCYYDKQFEEIIFSTIEKVIENPICNDSVKVMILQDLAYLNYLDIDRSFNIFKKLTNTENIEILKSSINCAQYFNSKYHDEMDYYFDIIIKIPELHKIAYFMVSSWMLDYDKEKKLYDRFIVMTKETKICAIDVAENFLIDKNKNINQKALSILFEFLDEKDKELASEYSGLILRKFKLKNFEELLSFMDSYSKSVLFRKDPRYFLKYLLKSSKYYPKECIQLLDNMNFINAPSIQDSGYYDKEPIQLVLAIYSKLVSEINKDKIMINKTLDIFDRMLKHPHLRLNAASAIEIVI